MSAQIKLTTDTRRIIRSTLTPIETMRRIAGYHHDHAIQEALPDGEGDDVPVRLSFPRVWGGENVVSVVMIENLNDQTFWLLSENEFKTVLKTVLKGGHAVETVTVS